MNRILKPLTMPPIRPAIAREGRDRNIGALQGRRFLSIALGRT
jgi:hypothetical protein